MTIKLSNIHELHITVHPDKHCTVDFIESGRRLATEEWSSLDDVISEYC